MATLEDCLNHVAETITTKPGEWDSIVVEADCTPETWEEQCRIQREALSHLLRTGVFPPDPKLIDQYLDDAGNTGWPMIGQDEPYYKDVPAAIEDITLYLNNIDLPGRM